MKKSIADFLKTHARLLTIMSIPLVYVFSFDFFIKYALGRSEVSAGLYPATACVVEAQQRGFPQTFKPQDCRSFMDWKKARFASTYHYNENVYFFYGKSPNDFTVVIQFQGSFLKRFCFSSRNFEQTHGHALKVGEAYALGGWGNWIRCIF